MRMHARNEPPDHRLTFLVFKSGPTLRPTEAIALGKVLTYPLLKLIPQIFFGGGNPPIHLETTLSAKCDYDYK